MFKFFIGLLMFLGFDVFPDHTRRDAIPTQRTVEHIMREPVAVICEMSQGIVERTTKQILAVIQARWFRHTDLQCEDGGAIPFFLA